MSQKRWEQQQAALESLASQGLSSAEIATQLGRTSRSVIGRAARTGVKLLARKVPDDVQTRRWDDADHAQLVELAGQGVLASEIARRLNRSVPSIVSRAYRYCVQLPQAPAHPDRPRAPSPGSWSPEEQERLALLAREGLSASEIAQKLKRTRNAVVGRAYRTSVSLLVGYDSPGDKAQKRIRARGGRPAPKARPAKLPRPKLSLRRPVDESILIRIGEIKAHHCKFPIKRGPDNEWLFCNQPQEEDSPYCPEHTRDCYRERKRYKR